MKFQDDIYPRPGLSVREAEIQFMFEQSVLGFVLDQTPIPYESLRAISIAPRLSEHTLSHVNDQIPRPIDPREVDGIRDRAEKINQLMTKLWELYDKKTQSHTPGRSINEDDGRALPSTSLDTRFGYPSTSTKKSTQIALARRGVK